MRLSRSRRPRRGRSRSLSRLGKKERVRMSELGGKLLAVRREDIASAYRRTRSWCVALSRAAYTPTPACDARLNPQTVCARACDGEANDCVSVGRARFGSKSSGHSSCFSDERRTVDSLSIGHTARLCDAACAAGGGGTMGEVATALAAFDDAFGRCLGALRGADAVRPLLFSIIRVVSPSRMTRAMSDYRPMSDLSD